MRMLDQLRDKCEEIRSFGREERAAARSENVSSFYNDASDICIIEDRADGKQIRHPSGLHVTLESLWGRA